MNVTNLKTKAETHLREQFDAAVAGLPGTGWVTAMRAKAFDAFAAEGLPHRRVEEWKYTDLRERLKDVPAPAAVTSAAVSADLINKALGPLAALDAERIVLIDGLYSSELSKVGANASTIELMSLAAALKKAPGWLESKFTNDSGVVVALNRAFMTDGVMLKVRKGQDAGKPVLLVHARASKEANALAVRNVVSVEAGAKLLLIEAHVALDGAGRGALSNAVTDVTVADEAECTHLKSLVDGAGTTHLATWSARLGKDASYRGFQLTASPARARRSARSGSTSRARSRAPETTVCVRCARVGGCRWASLSVRRPGTRPSSNCSTPSARTAMRQRTSCRAVPKSTPMRPRPGCR